MIDSRLLEIAVCPRCHSSLRLGPDSLACTGAACGLVYRISDGVPVLLVDEADPADDRKDPRER